MLQNSEILTRAPYTRAVPVDAPDWDGSREWRDLVRCSSEEARALLPREIAEEFCLLPLGIVRCAAQHEEQSMLVVVFGGTPTHDALQEIRFRTGFDVVAEQAPARIVQRALHAAYGGSGNDFARALIRAEADLQPTTPIENPGPESRPIPALLEQILERAHVMRASDVHLEPWEGIYRLRYRIDGVLELENEQTISIDTAQRLIRRLKILANLNPNGTPTTIDGGFSIERPGCKLRIRLSSLPQVTGEKVVLRIFDEREGIPEGLRGLGFSVQQERYIRSALALSSGAIVLAGPTGSGKSTLLYAALNLLNVTSRNIITLEDPVERIIPGISQIDLSHHPDRSPDSFLRGVLRQDPNVVMLGEIRDRDTARTALGAALTGHLVLTTVHATNCLETFLRLEQLTAERSLISAAVRLTVAQRLVPKNCNDCRTPVQPSNGFVNYFAVPESTSLLTGSGCVRCNGTGHLGRLGVFEFFPMSSEFRNFYDAGGDPLHYDPPPGFRTLAHGVRDALLAGIISPNSALHALGISPDIL